MTFVLNNLVLTRLDLTFITYSFCIKVTAYVLAAIIIILLRKIVIDTGGQANHENNVSKIKYLLNIC